MRQRAAALPGLAMLLWLAGCASPVTTTPLDQINQFSGYRYTTLDAKAPKDIDKAAVVVTFSGGGTRAAALADGALRALARTQVNGRQGLVPLSSQIDVMSSVSGGSVTAAAFALGGVSGLDSLESDFLRQDVMSDLLWRVATNPTRLFYPRVRVLADYLDEGIFHHATFDDVIATDKTGTERHPYVVLNASDMARGTVFSFTQDQFDLMCTDLGKIKIADAVAASAAVPVALSAQTVENHAPCPAQARAMTEALSGWRYDGTGPAPLRIINDRAAESSGGMTFPMAGRIDRFRGGTANLAYLNRDGATRYVQLLDGGIADNIGLTLPFTLLTSTDESPSIRNWVNTGKVDKLLLLVVNARSQGDQDYGSQPASPGMVKMLSTTIDTAIDGNSFKLLDRLDETANDGFVPKSVVIVDFDFIKDAACRDRFHSIATSWTLERADVDDLIDLGEAMVLQSPRYADFVRALEGLVPTPRMSVAQICARRGRKSE